MERYLCIHGHFYQPPREDPWLEAVELQEADKQSRERFSGHGSALAQACNHLILPLASRRDKYTQVLWGSPIRVPRVPAR